MKYLKWLVFIWLIKSFYGHSPNEADKQAEDFLNRLRGVKQVSISASGMAGVGDCRTLLVELEA